MKLKSTSGIAAGPYSQAIKAAGLVFAAGQIPADSTGKLVSGSIAEKTEQCCKNLKAILDAAGSGIPKVVKVGVSRIPTGDAVPCPLSIHELSLYRLRNDMLHWPERNIDWCTDCPAFRFSCLI